MDEVAGAHAHAAALTACGGGGKIIRHLGDAVGDEGGGQGDDAAEDLVILEAVAEGAVAAHAEAADGGILPLLGQGEDAAGELDELIADEGGIVGVPAGLVHIEAVLSVGAEHGDAELLGQLLDLGPPEPVRVAAGVAVEQIDALEGLVRIEGDAGEGRLLRRDDGRHIRVAVHGVGIHGEGKGCHILLLSLAAEKSNEFK